MVFVSKTQTLIPANINEFTVLYKDWTQGKIASPDLSMLSTAI